jgi:8-oxo-dGTP pyrophosphatase MutT (NUDIX family)
MNVDQIRSLDSMLERFMAVSASDDATHNADCVRRFIARVARPWSRATLEGHLTASAWVLDRSHTHVAMLHHRKLDRWLQPGGHIDDNDSSWRGAARRELEEETGLTRFLPSADEAALFDVDVHAIPARSDEPAHWHYDLRFLFVADVDAGTCDSMRLNPEESHDCRWFALAALANDPSLAPETQRMVELTLRSIPFPSTP